MVMTKMDIMLFRMIKNSKSQFIAVLIIIVAGICIYTSMGMVSDNLFHTVNSYYMEKRFPHLFIQVQGAPVGETARLSEIDGINQVSGSLIMDVPVLTTGDERRKTLRLITLEEGGEEGLSKSTLLEGRPLSERGKEVWLIGQYAKANGIVPGDEIKIQAAGVDHTLKVAGIVANPEHIYMVENVQSIMPDDGNFGVCYISESAGRTIIGDRQNYNYIRIEYESGADEKTVILKVEERLRAYGLQSVVKREDQLSNAVVQEELINIGRLSDYLPVLFLVTAAFILIMILSRMVKNDRLKIGVLKAVGYSNMQIMIHYMKYAIIAGLVGGFLGAATGMALANAMTKLFLEYFHLPMLKFQFDIAYLFSAMLLTAVFCLISGLLGARGALGIMPADAMQEEPPKSGKRILLEAITPMWKRFSFSRKLLMKNIFRNKKRTIFMVSGIATTYAMMLFTATMPAVVDQMMNQHFSEFQKMDYDIGFHKPVGERAVKDLTYLIDVDHAEGKIDFPFELSRGNRKQAVNIIGLRGDTLFYEFRDIKGQLVAIQQGGILLSENLAGVLKVSKGDVIQVKSYISDRDDLLIPVAGVIKQTLGMNAYMEIEAMRNIFLEKELITGVLINSRDKAIYEKLLGASNVAGIMSTDDLRYIYEDYMKMIFTSIAFMLVFSGIIGFCIVYIATMVSINEREGEFSSLRVLGFTKSEIFGMIRRENNIITVAGIAVGIPLGKMFSRYSSIAFTTDIYTLDMSPGLREGVWAGVFTLVCVLFAQLATYRKIHRLDFLQALKNRAG